MLDIEEKIESGQYADVLIAIRDGTIELESAGEFDETPLFFAVAHRTNELVRKLIALGANVNARASTGEHCLSIAIENNDLQVVEMLVKAGADIEALGPSFLTSLALASVRGYVPIMEFLLDSGADIEARGEMGETPLIEACFFNQPLAVTCLLKRQAICSATDNFGRTALEMAMHRGHLECAELIRLHVQGNG